MRLLIVRPEPGAGESAARARALGLEPIIAPLFETRPLAWTPPDPAAFDAVLLTSANAARLGGAGLSRFLALPCYAVGESTAKAAHAAGFRDVRTGPSDGAALADMARQDGATSLLHLGGRDHLPLQGAVHVAVYASEEAGALPSELGEAVVLLHSARAAARVAALARDRGRLVLAALSAPVAAAAGGGWRAVAIAAAPRDEALLELAAKLCQKEGGPSGVTRHE
jgi:uroporphyrinogen-III synthase